MNCQDRIANLMGWKNSKVQLWFQTKNPLLGNVSPDEMILAGRLDRLKKFISEAEDSAAGKQG